MRIYLIGYMGAGKTTASKKLARLTGFDCYDLDELFEEKYKISIEGFFSKYDETLFRMLESKLLKETDKFHNTIIATGGGTPCFYDNMTWMNQNGLTVYLQMHPKSIFKRLILSKRKRPLVANKTPEDLLQYIKEHLRQRNIFYSQAKIIIKAESLNLEELHKSIVEHL